MATYAELKQDVIDLINRTDCTDTLAGTFVNQAQRKISRTLRVPSLENKLAVTAGTTSAATYDAAKGEITIPSDFLEMVYIYTDKAVLQRTPLRVFIELDKKVAGTGAPKYYTRVQNKLALKPVPTTGTVVNLVYYSDPVDMSANSDTNSFSAICPDLMVYGALLYACDYFNDNRKAVFEATYNTIYAELVALVEATDQATADSSVQPSYSYTEDLLN
jgi:hypothetical protein